MNQKQALLDVRPYQLMCIVCRLMGKEAFPSEWWVVNLAEDGRLEEDEEAQ